SLKEVLPCLAPEPEELVVRVDVAAFRAGESFEVQLERRALAGALVVPADCVCGEEVKMPGQVDVVIVDVALGQWDDDAIGVSLGLVDGRVYAAPHPDDAPPIRQVCQVGAYVVIGLVRASGVAQSRYDVVGGHLGAGCAEDLNDVVGSMPSGDAVALAFGVWRWDCPEQGGSVRLQPCDPCAQAGVFGLCCRQG